MTGLLVFLGLLGTFWGLIETVGSVGKVIEDLKVGGDAGDVFDALKEASRRRSSGMGISFSSSLFGLAGSLVLGFLDLQAGQAQNRFYTELEDWLSTTVSDLAGTEPRTRPQAAPSGELRIAIERLKETIAESGSSRAATTAMANLAEAIQGLVHHMRTEQQMIRDWVDSQAERHREIQAPARRSCVRENATSRTWHETTWHSHAPAATRGMNYWPGFVDALSTLILGIMFLLSVFVVVQFYPVAGSDRQGHRAQPAQRADRPAHRNAVAREDRQGQPRGAARPAAREPRHRRRRARPASAGSTRASAAAQRRQGRQRACRSSSTPRRAVARARWRRSRCSTSRSPRCAASSRRSKARSRRRSSKDKDSQTRIADLGQRLNLALAQRVQELRAIAPTSSGGCAPSSAIDPISASSAIASCSSRKCSSMSAWRCSSRKAAPSSTRSRAR